MSIAVRSKHPYPPDKGRSEAIRRILCARSTNSDTLDLGGLGLTEIPSEILELRPLKRLFLGLDECARSKSPHVRTHDDNRRRNTLREIPRDVLSTHSELDLLDLEANAIGDSGAGVIAEHLGSLTHLNLSRTNIGDVGARAIAEHLTSITNLQLWRNRIGDDGARAIGERLPSLADLNMSFNRTGEDGARAIAKGLVSLINLDFSGNNIGEAGAHAIAQRLVSLKSLKLYGCNIGDGGARAIAEHLSSLTNLQLWENGIGEVGARAIAEGLPALTSLNLNANNIGPIGARAIAEHLPLLTSLDVYANKIGDVGACAIAKSLPSLTSLQLWHNGISAAGALAIAEHLTLLTNLNLNANFIGEAGATAVAERLTTLTALNLAQNNVGDFGAFAIGEHLTSLSSLGLRGNKITQPGVRAIAEGLTSLNDLDLSDNNIGDGAQAIAEHFTSISKLHLNRSNVGPAGAQAIAEHLVSLTELDLRANSIGEEGARAIAKHLTALGALDIGFNNIGDAGAQAIAEGLPFLVELDLTSCGVRAAGVDAIAEHLTSLNSLHLGFNDIGDTGAYAIAERLTALTRLNLEYSKVGEPGADAIAKHLTSLTRLDLHGNAIGDAGAHAIARHLTDLVELDLSGCHIGDVGARAIAEWLGSLTDLRLGDNNIREAGARAIARHLPSLTSLDLDDNHLGDASAQAIAEHLTELTSLSLNNCQIGSSGAVAIAERLASLTRLGLSGNDIRKAGAIAIAGRLMLLTRLGLGGNKIGDGVYAIAERLPSLTTLNLDDNNVGDTGARAIAENLASLTDLSLDQNSIGDVGASAIAEKLTSLANLSLNQNNVGDPGARAIAEHLTLLADLHLRENDLGEAGVRAIIEAWELRESVRDIAYLDLSKNEKAAALLPPEVIGQTDASAIIAAWRNLQEAAGRQGGLRQFNEAKLLLVGDEASGKSSLVRFLAYEEPRIEGNPKTPGIEVRRWQLKRRDEHRKWTLNVWDFAGQEIAFGTHQYFLTERSIYLLVLNDRKEDDRRALVRWLRAIKNRGGQSPIIIVVNQSDADKAERVLQRTGNWGLALNEEELRKDPQIVGVLRTSCNNDDYSRSTIARLEDAIVDVLAGADALAEIRRGVPNEWLRIKARVTAEAGAAKVLNVARYAELCTAVPTDLDLSEGLDGPPLTDPVRQRALLAMLHNLGVIVAYGLEEGASPTREKSLLDPNWLTDAFYTVLNSGLVRDQNGEFTRVDLGGLLDKAFPGTYPARDHHFIIEMMQDPSIELAVQSSEGPPSRYLVPQVLPQLEPALSADVFGEDVMRTRYRYATLPASFMPKLIVKTASKSLNPPHRWRSGVGLRIDDCPVRIAAVQGPRDSDVQQVDILVAGPKMRRRDAMRGARLFMEQLHRDNPGIEPIEYVPLPDDPGKHVELSLLRQLQQRGRSDVVVPIANAQRDYTVSDLLENAGHDVSNLARDDGVPAGGANATQRIGSVPWWKISLGAGALLSIIVWLMNPFDLNDQRRLFASALGAGLLLFSLMMLLNPAYMFRRLFSIWLSAGGLYLFLPDKMWLQILSRLPVIGDLIGEVRGDGHSPLVLLVWFLVLLVLLVADLRVSGENRS